MQNLIVLGLVPGTQIQINFFGWLAIISMSLLILSLATKRHTVRAAILSWYVARLIRHYNPAG